MVDADRPVAGDALPRVDLLPGLGPIGGRVGRRRRRRRTRLLVSVLTAGVVVVLGGAVALAANVTHSDSSTAVRSVAAAPRPSVVASPVPTVTPSPVPAPVAESPNPESPNPKLRRTATPTSKPTPVVRPSVPVLVLNNSTVQGLAARSADRVRNVGFAVRGVGNLYGRHARTTVYYRPGYADQAWLLAGSLRGMQDVVAAPSWLPGHAPVTLVVTRDFGN
jgi:hypothetical protein